MEKEGLVVTEIPRPKILIHEVVVDNEIAIIGNSINLNEKAQWYLLNTL